jgi:hypothetical protein
MSVCRESIVQQDPPLHQGSPLGSSALRLVDNNIALLPATANADTNAQL